VSQTLNKGVYIASGWCSAAPSADQDVFYSLRVGGTAVSIIPSVTAKASVIHRITIPAFPIEITTDGTAVAIFGNWAFNDPSAFGYNQELCIVRIA
jgi:hypothetical protein